jgi:hypothetical protein
MAQSQTNLSEVILKDDAYPLLSPTILNQTQIEKGGNSIPISNLVLLPQVLASLDLPPNSTTLLINDTIELTDGSDNAVLSIDVSGNLSINPSLNLVIGSGSSYNNLTNTWTATNFNGTASLINVISDNTANNCFIPMVKIAGTGSKALFIDDVTGPLTYNPATGILTCQQVTATTFSGTATNATNVNVVATNTTNVNYSVNFSTASGNTSIRSDTNLTYNPSTNLMTLQNLTASTQVSTPLVVNSTGNVEITTQTTTGSLDLNSTILNFKNTSTTTSISNHDAKIKATSNGLESTKFLKVKLNGADIWIAYFTQDPSL